MKKIIPLILILILTFILSSCGTPTSLKCANCNFENELTCMYCVDCGNELVLDEETESAIGVERVDNREEIIDTWMSEGKYQEAYDLVDSLPISEETFEKYRDLGFECKYLLAETIENNDEAYMLYSEIWHYKDSEEKAKERFYQAAIEALDNNDIYKVLFVYYSIGNYKDLGDIVDENIDGNKADFYNKGIEYYLEGNLEYAKGCFYSIGKYKDAKQMLKCVELMEETQGSYHSDDDDNYLVLEDNILYEFDTSTGDIVERESVIIYHNGYYIVPKERYDMDPTEDLHIKEVRIDEDNDIKILYIYPKFYEHSMSNNFCYYVETLRTREEIENIVKNVVPYDEKPVPAIGMTADEVRASQWGYPIDINKTTYSWGVKEQWVYTNDRYIYLEDGIVTAISE